MGRVSPGSASCKRHYGAGPRRDPTACKVTQQQDSPDPNDLYLLTFDGLPRRNTAAMALHLAEISRTVPPGALAVLLLDQAGCRARRSPGASAISWPPEPERRAARQGVGSGFLSVPSRPPPRVGLVDAQGSHRRGGRAKSLRPEFFPDILIPKGDEPYQCIGIGVGADLDQPLVAAMHKKPSAILLGWCIINPPEIGFRVQRFGFVD